MLCCLCDPVFNRFSRTPTCVRQTDTDRDTGPQHSVEWKWGGVGMNVDGIGWEKILMECFTARLALGCRPILCTCYILKFGIFARSVRVTSILHCYTVTTPQTYVPPTLPLSLVRHTNYHRLSEHQRRCTKRHSCSEADAAAGTASLLQYQLP